MIPGRQIYKSGTHILSMGRRRGKHSHRKQKLSFNNSGCAFCGANLEGLPHTCKFCGDTHCSDHLLPENHNCRGLSHPKTFAESPRFSSWGSQHKSSRNSHFNKGHHSAGYRNDYHDSHHHSRKRDWSLPRIRLPRISRFFKALIVAILFAYLAYMMPQYSILLWVEAAAWIYFSFVLYRKAFHWANRINLGNDLAFFGLRLLGGAIVLVGFYIGFFSLLATALTPNSASQAIPIFMLLAGAMILGLFIAFRTNRRHHVVGIWQA